MICRMEGPAYITLSELQQRVGNTLRLNRELQNVWILAELSDVRVNGGHCYMELIEKDPQGLTRAKIRAMIWNSRLPLLRRKFFDSTGLDICSGMKMLLCASVSHHNLYGLSLVVNDVDPSYTLGETERIRREILERLAKEGVLEQNKRIPLSDIPQTIAVISAPGAAGYGDFMNQITSGADGFVLYPMLFPAVMQGVNTAPSVMAALDLVEASIDLWDCVVIIRGGGATTDLNGFDNYELARRVATFGIPVVVGIGHERDRTVLDEIACVRCKTPTAVAAFLVDRLREAYTTVTNLVTRIGHYGADALRGERHRLANAESMIPLLATTRLREASTRLEQAAASIGECAGRRIAKEDARLDRFAMQAEQSAKNRLQRADMQLQRMGDLLRVLDPANTLRRGYSITRIGGHALKDPSGLKPGDEIETVLASGSVISRVREVAEGDAAESSPESSPESSAESSAESVEKSVKE